MPTHAPIVRTIHRTYHVPSPPNYAARMDGGGMGMGSVMPWGTKGTKGDGDPWLVWCEQGRVWMARAGQVEWVITPIWPLDWVSLISIPPKSRFVAYQIGHGWGSWRLEVDMDWWRLLCLERYWGKMVVNLKIVWYNLIQEWPIMTHVYIHVYIHNYIYMYVSDYISIKWPQPSWNSPVSKSSGPSG